MPESLRSPWLAMSRNARFVAFRQGDRLEVVDARGQLPRRTLPQVAAFAWIGSELWISDRDGVSCVKPHATVAIAGPRDVTSIIPLGDATAILASDHRAWLVDAGAVTPLADARYVAGCGRRVVAIGNDGTKLVTIGRDDATVLPVGRGTVMGASLMFAGRAVALWVREAAEDALISLTSSGQLIRRIAAPKLDACAFAGQAGLAISGAGSELCVFDMRYGERKLACSAEADIVDVDVDDCGRQLVIARRGGDDELSISLIGVADLFAARAVNQPQAARAADAPEPVADDGDCSAPAAAQDEVAALEVSVAAAAAPIRSACTQPPIDIDAWLDAELARLWTLGERRWRSLQQAGLRPRAGDPQIAELEDLLAVRPRLDDALRPSWRVRSPLGRLATAIGLGELEADALLALVAPSIDPPLGVLFRALHGPAQGGTHATLLMELFELRRSDRLRLLAALAANAPLVKWGLVQLGEGPDAAHRPLACSDDVATILTAHAVDSDDGAPIAAAEIIAVSRELAGLFERDRGHGALIWGARGAGKAHVAREAARMLGRPLRAWRTGDRGSPAMAARAALAQDAVLYLGFQDPAGAEAERALIDDYPGTLVVGVAAREPAPLSIERRVHEVVLPELSIAASECLWDETLPRAPHTLRRAVARAYRLTRGEIAQCADEVRHVEPDQLAERLRLSIERRLRNELGEVATRREVTASWDDLVLPPHDLSRVHEFIARYTFSSEVFDDWGFRRRTSYGHGLIALFSGDPGTGKTLLAGLIAQKLDLALYQVDLSRVLSKWVGETEKQLDRVFDAAERAHAVLLFDEADALFGKRTDSEGANDHYANVAINHLLQRIERYNGVAVLTTNKPAALDPALRRRLSLQLHLDPPAIAERKRLWRSLIPAPVPLAGDVDFGVLARVELTGGYIRNIALRAAFQARAANRPVTMALLEHCIALELEDLGRVVVIDAAHHPHEEIRHDHTP